MDLHKLQESRLSDMKSQRTKLVEQWQPYLGAVEGYLKSKGKDAMSEIDKHNVAQCLENALIEGSLKGGSRLFEGTTYQSDIAFLGVQLPVIAALLPSLVLNKLGIVQALDRRQAAVFYLDVKYNNAKGSVLANETSMSATTGHDNRRGGRLYASSRVVDEAFGATGTGSLLSFSAGSLAYLPIISQLDTVIVSWVSGGVTYTMSNSVTATALTSAYGTGTIVLATGAISVTIISGFAPTNGTRVTVEYRYDYERTTSAIPGVNISLTSSTITAEDFPLRADYTLGASIDLQKAHGLNLEDELVKYLGGEIKFELDHLGIDLMLNAATSSAGAGAAPTFTGTLGSGQEWIWRRLMFIDNVEAGSNLILAATLRGQANFLVVGNNVARLVRQLAPHFVPAPGLNGVVPTGPYELGTLDGRLIIHDPFLPTNRYLLGFKGDNYLFAGFIFAPYIPLMATPTLLTADLKAQKGFLASAGYKLVNSKMYAYGDIASLQS